MKKIILTILLSSVLPGIAAAEEKKMRNTNPSPTAKPEHVMRNTNPSPAKAREHVMRNTNPNTSTSTENQGVGASKESKDIQQLKKD